MATAREEGRDQAARLLPAIGETLERAGVARQEIAQWKNFDYLIVSKGIADDLRNMQAIIEAEKMLTARSVAPEF